MQKACVYLPGTKDFSSFAKIHTDVKNHLCEVKNAEIHQADYGVRFTISANRFLRNMVRAIVGTLVEIGLGKCPADTMQTIINQKDRSAAGASAPACGLFLSNISYPNYEVSCRKSI